MTELPPPTINEIEDLDCDICGKPLKGYKGYMTGLTRPVPNREGFHEYYKAIHIECYKAKTLQ